MAGEIFIGQSTKIIRDLEVINIEENKNDMIENSNMKNSLRTILNL